MKVSIVAREAFLEQLGSCLRLALGSERQVAFITGEPGIGNTALADAFQTPAVGVSRELLIARGQCVECNGAVEAFYLVLEAPGQLFQSSSDSRLIVAVAALRLSSHSLLGCERINAAICRLQR
jgi:predicted ATPase